MDLKARLQEDLKAALRSQDERRKAVIRMCLAAIQLAEVEHEGPLDESTALAVLQKEAKERRETIDQFKEAGRPERVAKEEAELAILESYLPHMLTREDIEAEARAVIAEVDASGLRDMGAVMRELMDRVRGRAEGRLVSEVVRELLSA